MEKTNLQSLQRNELLPPSYEEATTPSSTNELTNGITERNLHPLQQTMLATYLDKLRTSTDVPSNAEMIFSLDEVRLFFISSEGSINSPSNPTSLAIYSIVGSNDRARTTWALQLSGWLRVGVWIHPLIPGCSPALRTNYGGYIFPDTNSQGAAVGLLLPESIDSDCRLSFDNILAELTLLKRQEKSIGEDKSAVNDRRLSETISNGIITGAELLATGINFGANITSNAVHFCARNVLPTFIDPRVLTGLQYACAFTATTASLSSYLVQRLANAIITVGGYVVPHATRQLALLLARPFCENPQEIARTIDDVLLVSYGGVRGLITIYLSLENAARILGASLLAGL